MLVSGPIDLSDKQVGPQSDSVLLQDRVPDLSSSCFFPSNLHPSPDHLLALQGAVQGLLLQGVSVPVPERFQAFYSNLFMIPPKKGIVWPILNLEALNNYVRKFRMESIRSVVASLHQGDFLASIDINDAYPHISPLCCGRGALLVCGVVLWTRLCSSGLHQSGGPGSGAAAP